MNNLKKCLICQSTIEKGDYCDAHLIAKNNLIKNYSYWKEAFGDLSWKDYLNRMVNDAEIPVGDWAKEVADYYLKNNIPLK